MAEEGNEKAEPKEPNKADEAVTKPAEPNDDLVVTEHELNVGRSVLNYTATTGRVVLREEVYEDGTFTGFKAKAEMSITSYVVDGRATSAGR